MYNTLSNPQNVRNSSQMKTTKQIFAALLIIAAVVLFGGFLAYSQDRPTPTPPVFPDCTESLQPPGCTGTCPILWAAGNPNAIQVPPDTDHAHPNPCHKILGHCTCAYRNGGGADCHPSQEGGQCEDHGCPNLYRTAQDAQNGTNPVFFANKVCKKDGIECNCYYY